MNLRKDHSCDHAVKVMIGWRTEARQCSVGCCASVHNSRVYLLMLCCISQLLLHIFMNVWKLSATDVLVHMLMKGAAKCNNHCELQNSVNQLTIERRSALGAFLRACLCQCSLCFSGDVFFWEHDDCASSLNACCVKHRCLNAWSLLLALLCTLLPGEPHEHDIKQSNLLNLSI